ncbi:MAG: AraC family transcriptional regulator [Lachnospiraceae bacterium]|nr:AraC family transcriptional regulator [Lachnospiraceae bacterium]
MPYEFPLAVHETFLKDKPRGFNDWHWHEEIQFSYILEGEMIMTCMGHDFLLRPGDGIFLNSNCSHMSRPVNPESARYLSLNIKPSLLTLFHGSVVEQKYFLPYANSPKMQVIAFSPEIPEEAFFLEAVLYLFRLIQEKGFGYELEVYAQLLHVWKTLLIISETHSVQPLKLEREEAHAMLMYIHQHFTENITIEDLSKHVHLSKGECSRVFQAAYGTSITTHIIDYRISQSIPLLSGTNLSMTQIAEQCGFNSSSYFTKVFREKVGMPPLQYRKEQIEK